MKVVFSTSNRGKLRELAALVTELGIEIVTPADLGLTIEVSEDAPTFEGNALKKARAAAETAKLPALADDSGLEVDALGGAPGVRSARYAGTGHDDGANNRKLLAEMAAIADDRRTARFRCAMAYVEPGGRELVSDGRCEGRILRAPRGTGGFGYDPLFEVVGTSRTMAELSLEEKNRISHRAQAMKKMAALLGRAT